MSEIRANTVSDAAGTGPATLTGQYAAKAWVNFNGTGTVAIRESGNVSSITDNGAGDYTVNLTTALTDANYSIPRTASHTTNVGFYLFGDLKSQTTSSFRFVVGYITGFGAGGTNFDLPEIHVSAFR